MPTLNPGRFLQRIRSGSRLAHTLWGVQYATMLEYRAEIALWALSGVLPFIMLSLWSAAGGAAAASGFSQPELARYFLWAFVARQFSVVWVVWQFEEDTIQGRLSPYLLQPLHPLWRYVAAHQAEQATRLPFVVAIAVVFFLLQPQAFSLPGPGRFLLGVLAVLLAFGLNFLLQSLIAALCFWSERASALERLLYIPYLFLSGLVAPLETFPEPVRAWALRTPFPLMVAFPARLLSGDPFPAGPHRLSVTGGFAALALWIAVLLPLLALVWRAGVRRYSAMGA
jgi:ABC-2 type transport system permease protein